MSEVIQKNKVKLDTLLWQVRELCRKHKLQVWGNQSLPNQIYQDLLFIYHVPALCVSGNLELDVEYIGDGKLTEVSYKSLLSLKEPTLINTAFKRLWKKLQNCVLKPLFEGREFVMFAIEKKDAKKYMTLLLDIMNYLASIELEKYDSNAGYTYFKKDLNKNVAKTFGQFYTPSSVTASVVKQVDPKTGESILDPSSGSCSFLAEAANHIAKSESVDMTTAFKDLYGTEVEPNIYAEGVMNMFINFGILPDMNQRIREVDALLDMAKNTMLFKKIVANPPFGANASSFLEFYYQTIIEPPTGKAKKGTKKVILNPEVKCEIPFPKISESAILFFQYIVQKLAPGGKAGVVMSATIFNDGFKDMMKWFLECCSLEKIIINPAGTFKEQGTGIETFSFIFTKGSPTTKVDIVMLAAEDDVVRSLTIDQVKEAGWKLQVKEEEKKVEYTGKYELKKLGDLLDEFTTGKNCSETQPGDIPFYMSNGIAQYVDIHQFDGDYVLTARCGSLNGCQFHVNGKFCASDFTYVMKTSQNLLSQYLYYTLKSVNWIPMSSGTTMKGIKRDIILSLQIPTPPLAIQQEIVTALDRIFADPQDMKDCLAFTDKAMDLMLKDPSGKALEDVMGGLRLKRSQLATAASIKAQKAAVMRSVGARGYEKKKISEVCNFVGGKGNQDRSDEYKIPYYESNGIYGYVKDALYTGEYIITARCMSIGSVHYVNGPFYPSDHTINMTSSDNTILDNRFFYNWLLLTNKVLKDLSSGIKPGIRKSDVMEIKMPLPPLPIQQETLAILNEMEAELKVMEQMAAKAEQRAKYILDGYLSNKPSSEPAPMQEVPEPIEEAQVPVNEIVNISVAPVAAMDPPKPKKTVLKLKKQSP